MLVFLSRWEPEGTDNPEIIDDWPLHKVSGLSTKVTVGACWQGILFLVINTSIESTERQRSVG